ncbi:AI-2E family transporter [Patescibacteria group bacterium]|nr:AI-2E family transporter [Patescibacteria group bacterium]
MKSTSLDTSRGFVVLNCGTIKPMPSIRRVVEYAFFFALLLTAAYMVWLIVAPFFSALALAVIIVIICYPLYERILRIVPRQNRTLASLCTTLVVVLVVVLPLVLISSILVREAVSFYQSFGSGQELAIEQYVTSAEQVIQRFIPEFELNVTEQLRESAVWLTRNLGAIFAGTLSTLFVFVIALIGSFYFFRDGKEFLKLIIKASPLPEREDAIIFARLTQAVRSVVTGTVLIALLQGTLAAIGFTIFGVPQAVLWGSMAAVGALIPGIGTMVIMVPAVAFLFITGSPASAVGLMIWGATVVGTIDNFLGPYLMSRGNKLHPFMTLLSALGGIALFGPIGFIIGPVIMTLFMVLLELYHQYIVNEEPMSEHDADS